MRLLSIVLLVIISLPIVKAQELSKAWEVTGLEAPESAVYYEDAYYVSNVAGQPAEKNGLGYISKIGIDGKLIKQKWATGFNAPKGLGIYKNLLYIADIDIVLVIDLKSGSTIKEYKAEGATFLNDIAISKNGTVYISDTFGGNAIYKIENSNISLWLKDERLDYPNGLLIQGNNLLVASWGVVTDTKTFGTELPGKLLSVSLKSKRIDQKTSNIGNLDGLVSLKKGTYLVSDWIAGGLISIDKSGHSSKILSLNSGTADLTLIKKQKILLVPQMLEGKLSAFLVQ